MQTEESGAHSESRALTDFMSDAYTYTKKKKSSCKPGLNWSVESKLIIYKLLKRVNEPNNAEPENIFPLESWDALLRDALSKTVKIK